jgi:RimJ/RimL family protein N-acetyltransferase
MIPATGMVELDLVAVGERGTPAQQLGRLPKIVREVCAVSARLYESSGFAPPWIGYLAVADGEPVGACTFKSPPRDGRVEIAYFTFHPFEGRGIATQMAAELVSIARSAAPGILITAQTTAPDNASTSVLKHIGFQLAGPLEHPQDGLVWEWQYGPL